ncbi:sigma-70 family RNA polymerase sigma factor [uncultured Paludibaculum sp.]|uniref:RNA polymerase sigma factor n=1 Tax=uncultured Paludibaculum sp. TaxID=1765020 RepID=UPI002AABAB79|nr:sigma-70 family RNA polymerase sigma factor [uncultured Paludibaculum sp.]
MSGETTAPERDELYASSIRAYGQALDRLARGYEADPEKRRDLRQEIHLRLWTSLAAFDGRCSLRTWTFRVAHNTAATWVSRERRNRVLLVSLEDIEQSLAYGRGEPDIDHHRALTQLAQLIHQLKPLDRQIMLCYLEEMDSAAIAEITGLSPANVSMKVHRIKTILARQFQQCAKDQHHA